MAEVGAGSNYGFGLGKLDFIRPEEGILLIGQKYLFCFGRLPSVRSSQSRVAVGIARG